MEENFMFTDFVPSTDLVNSARRIFEEIFALCPSESSVSANLIFRSEQFVCYLVVRTQNFIFQAEAKEKDPHQSILEVYKKVLSKLTEWQKDRFEVA